MLFNSLAFALFLPLVFAIYWGGGLRLKAQNGLLMVASFVFYGWWDWRYLFLLVGTSLVDFLVGRALGQERPQRQRRWLIGLSIGANLGLLGTFKYFDFFAGSLQAAFASVGITLDMPTLQLVLPVGISFYTFQALSYTIDVYRKQLRPTHDLVAFLAFISFFPQLVAGPIERGARLLPQMLAPRRFDPQLASDGVRQMLWGFFKKVAIADNCAPYVNDIFSNYADHPPGALMLAALLFSFQIYCDFSGYSDIAIGCARLFGFDLMRNFAYPYFSRDIAEFWRRWHISLSTWFRDNVYVPLGGSRVSRWTHVRNVLLVFLLSGLWHGANWTFICWGLMNALLFLPIVLRRQGSATSDIAAEGRLLPSARTVLQILFTFSLTTLAWVLFRSATITDAMHFILGMFAWGQWRGFVLPELWIFGLIGVMVLAEWVQRERPHALEVRHLAWPVRQGTYLGVFLLIFFFGKFNNSDFIYFQF